ncbi:unnamed protein product [Heterobilharzia americana]|nr:unnamed protein product [Heterobilharzia americana]
MKCFCFYLLAILPFVTTVNSFSNYQGDSYGSSGDNGDHYNTGYDSNSGDIYGKDNIGKVNIVGKFFAVGRADKGSKYQQVTSFHKSGRNKRKFSNYETKGRVHSYGKQNIRAKFGIESRIKKNGKFKGAGKLNGFYSDSYLPAEYGTTPAESLLQAGDSSYSPTAYDYYYGENGEEQNPAGNGPYNSGSSYSPPNINYNNGGNEETPDDNKPSNGDSSYSSPDYDYSSGTYEAQGGSSNGDSYTEH